MHCVFPAGKLPICNWHLPVVGLEDKTNTHNSDTHKYHTKKYDILFGSSSSRLEEGKRFGMEVSTPELAVSLSPKTVSNFYPNRKVVNSEFGVCGQNSEHISTQRDQTHTERRVQTHNKTWHVA